MISLGPFIDHRWSDRQVHYRKITEIYEDNFTCLDATVTNPLVR